MDHSKPSPMNDFAQVGRGILMGGADIIPGVSGGTIALILGIYERLVRAISHFDLALIGLLRRRQWSVAARHCDLRFLVALGCGILTGYGVLAMFMKYLLEDQRQLTLSAFFGLIVASSVLVARATGRWNGAKVALGLAAAAFAFWLVGQDFMEGSDRYDYLFLCGMVAICAMILPGISGSFILWIMGEYKFVLDLIHSVIYSVAHLEWPPVLPHDPEVDVISALAVFATGCAIGLLAFSKFLRWLLARYKEPTMAVLCGFMIGSLRCLWPFQVKVGETEQYRNVAPESPDQLVLPILVAAAAAAFVLALDRITRRHEGNA